MPWLPSLSSSLIQKGQDWKGIIMITTLDLSQYVHALVPIEGVEVEFWTWQSLPRSIRLAPSLPRNPRIRRVCRHYDLLRLPFNEGVVRNLNWKNRNLQPAIRFGTHPTTPNAFQKPTSSEGHLCSQHVFPKGPGHFAELESLFFSSQLTFSVDIFAVMNLPRTCLLYTTKIFW